MRPIIIFAITFSLSSMANAQEIPQVENVEDAIKQQIFTCRSQHDLMSLELIVHDTSTIRPKYAEEVFTEIKALLAAEATTDNLASQKILQRYENSFHGLFLALSSSRFIYKDELPMIFSISKAPKSFVIGGILARKKFNVLKTTSRERATSVVAELMLPSIGEIAKAFQDSDIRKIGIIVVYATSDFANDDKWGAKSEAIALMVSKMDALRFANAEMTDQEFMKRCTFYLSDGSYSSTMLVKLTIR